MNDKAIFTNVTVPPANDRDNPPHCFVVEYVPAHWIDELGMPSGAFPELAELINQTILAREAQKKTHVQVQFCYLYKGRAFAAKAERSMSSGISINITTNGIVGKMTPETLEYMEFSGLGTPSTAMFFDGRYCKMVRVRESLEHDPHWVMETIEERTTQRFDNVYGKSIDQTPPDIVDEKEQRVFRPATKTASIDVLARRLQRTPFGNTFRNENFVRYLRQLHRNQRVRGDEFDPDQVALMSERDVEIYDTLAAMITVVGDNRVRFFEVAARLAKFAHVILPNIYGNDYLRTLWSQTLMWGLGSGFQIDEVRRFKPSFGPEFVRNYELAIEKTQLPVDENWTEEGYASIKDFLIERFNRHLVQP